jgi:hypothetical protein
MRKYDQDGTKAKKEVLAPSQSQSQSKASEGQEDSAERHP